MTLVGAVVAGLFAVSPAAHAGTETRTLVVREGATASLLNGAFTFKVLKLNGYSIRVKVADQILVLKTDQSFAPTDTGCTVVFEEVATETRLARFLTNCS
ncbi:hypothetical protein [Falsiphaeobacter marinintestinus]|uniref:hypothetical protein n=1 Tax=Falsiphaeobacter marinintestinus TaxID=1492905 RepID=UPI001C970500|nr:hypothetical protein [Phaeobacter marinintestinus]